MLCPVHTLSLVHPKLGFATTFPPHSIPSNVLVFRADRKSAVLKQRSGCSWAVDKSLHSVRCEELETAKEWVWHYVRLHGGRKLIVGVFYVPPEATPLVFDSVLSFIKYASAVNSNHNLLVIGDFNKPAVHWDNATFSHYNVYKEQNCCIILD